MIQGNTLSLVRAFIKPYPDMQNTSSIISQKWVLPIAIAVLLLPIAIIEYWVLQHTDGVFSYGLDDTFIHLAIGKNLALHGVWGASPHEFASASSSVLYPLLIAAIMKVTGPAAIIPFILNLLAAITLLIVVQKWLREQGLGPAGQLLVLLAVVIFTPLPVTVIIGMEHTLQLLFCFLFVYSFSDALASPASFGEKSWNLPWEVYLYGFLMMACRYECGALVLIAAVILLYHRHMAAAFGLVIYASLPILLFGFYSLYNGSYFLPNSVLLKSQAPPLTFSGLYDFFTTQLYERLVGSRADYIYNTVSPQRLLLVLPLIYLAFIHRIRKRASYQYILILLTMGVLAHLSFADTTKSPRFEAYLVGCSVVIITYLIVRYGPEVWQFWTRPFRWTAFFIAAVLFFPLLLRSTQAFRNIGRSCVNIFDQQYQMAAFLHRNYNRVPVALNDIGAVSYLSDGSNLDLVGLSSLEMTRARLEDHLTLSFLTSLMKKKGVKIAVVYNSWFPPEILNQWSPVAAWTMKDNVICAGNTVTFYAVDSSIGRDLKSNLQAYQKSLPVDVHAYYY
jgi:hypothetical protein